VWGDIKRSAYFSADGPDASPILRRLEFSTQQSITADSIGQALQTMRGLTQNDTDLLVAWARTLSPEPRAYQVADEITLERSFEAGEEAVRETVAAYHVGVSSQKRSSLLTAFRRNRTLVEDLQQLYDGRCQLCGFDPKLVYGVRACNGHHIVYISRGGRDEMANLMLVCPNHHEVIHATSAVFDFKDLRYVFPNDRREPLVLNKHLGGAG
jgi:predicted restriction endonuclease